MTGSTRSAVHWTPSRTGSTARSVVFTRDVAGFQKREVDFTPDITGSSPHMTELWRDIIGLGWRAAIGPKCLHVLRRLRSIALACSSSSCRLMAIVDAELRCTGSLAACPGSPHACRSGFRQRDSTCPVVRAERAPLSNSAWLSGRPRPARLFMRPFRQEHRGNVA